MTVASSQWAVSSRDQTQLIDVQWFVDKIEHEAALRLASKENHLDFYKKYSMSSTGSDICDVEALRDELRLSRSMALRERAEAAGLGELELEEADNAKSPKATYVELVVRAEGGRKPVQDLGEVDPSWCLVFKLAEDDDGEYTKVTKECIDACQRLWAADLDLKHQLGSTGDEIFTTVGASYEILVDEANQLRPRMRLKHSKGSTPFTSEMIPHYTPCMIDEVRLRQTCFSSGIRQRLVLSRMKRIAAYDPEELQHYPAKEDTLEHVQKSIQHHKRITAHELREMLITHGGFWPHVAIDIGQEVADLAEQVLADPHFICIPTDKLKKKYQAMIHAQEENMRARGLQPVQYSQIEAAVKSLEAHVATEPGKSEQFVGSMEVFCEKPRKPFAIVFRAF